jgi:CheY-like chemotaxis protein
MLETPISQDRLIHWVRASLAHLYDAAYLQTHPWIGLPGSHTHVDDVTRAQRVRRLLLDCIEALRPQDDRAHPATAARAYVILSFRYVDGLSMEEIAEKLSLSRRQVYREHEKGIEAIASLLADKYDHLTEPASATAVEAEVDRLRRTVAVESLSVAELLRTVVAMLEPLGRETGLRIELRVDEPLPLVQADRVHVRQALISLLTYAVDIARTDVAQATIHVDAVACGPGVRVTIDVASVRRAPCISGPEEPPCVEVTIARSLIEAQGGSVDIRAGVGWQVITVLPAVHDQTIVLVIDDNADMVELFRRFLGGHHVKVVGVSDSDRALALSAELRPNVIVIDLMMPSLDGWDVLQQLKSRPETRSIPVIVCSVLNEAKLALAMGASGYLTKPVNQTEFLAVAQHWLGPLTAAQPSMGKAGHTGQG